MLRRRLGSSGRAILRTVSPRIWGGDGGDFSAVNGVGLPYLRRKASNTLSAVQDTYLSTKQVFENHRVVFTIGTSVASVLTAWAGYCMREIHQSKVNKRLETIEQALKNRYDVEHEEIKKIVTTGTVSTTACVATAWTTLAIGYVLGWRGGSWYVNRKLRREQLKLMGQLKPRRWSFLKKPLAKFRRNQRVDKTSDVLPMADAGTLISEQANKAC